MRRLLVAGSNVSLREAVAPLLDGREVLLLAPTKGAADEVLWDRPGGAIGVQRLTLAQLAAQFAAERVASLGLSPMSGLGQQALVARAVHQLRQNRQFSYFRKIADTPGFVKAAATTLNELRLELVDARLLAETGAPGADLALMLDEYEKQRQEAGLVDMATLFRFAAETTAHHLLGLPVILMDLPVRHKAGAALLRLIVERAPECLAVSLDGDRESIDVLAKVLAVPPVAQPAKEEIHALARVRRYLFSAESPPAGTLDDTVDCFSSPGESFECVEIVRRIHSHANAGIPFDRMAVLLRHPDRYQPLVEEALRRSGIPGWFSHGTLRPDPAGRAFLALLRCALEGLAATRFAEYLSLAQVPRQGDPAEPGFVSPQDEVLAALQRTPIEDAVPPDDAPSPAVPIGWEQLIVDAAVIGGRARWERRLNGLRNELRAQLDEVSQAEETKRAAIERRLVQIDNLAVFALPLIARLDTLPRHATWGDWTSILGELASAALREPEGVLAVLAELLPMKEVGPASLDEVYGVLRERMGFLRQLPPLRRFGVVFIGTIEEARGRSFEVVFLPGLAEGLFPRRLFEDPLLLDEFRGPLGLPGNDTRADRERLLLRIAMAAGERVVLSYPRMDTGQSRPRVPSFYALEVIRAAEGRLPDLRELADRTRQASSARLGWPAPTAPEQAIDAAEYDLATLGQIMKPELESSQRVGCSRYMVNESEPLGRSMRARWMRWERDWRYADGIIKPQAALESQRLTARAFSPTSLERFARCPYQFFLYAIHHLEERQEPVAIEQLDALTRGRLFHEVQYEIFRQLQPWQPRPLAKLLDVADRALDQLAAKYEEDLAPAIPRVWASEIEDLRTDLRGWIRETVGDSAWTPIAAESSFEVTLDSFRLRGKIDWIERNSRNAMLRVTDHKTGRAPERRPAFVGGGTVLQPVLYAMALARESGQPVGTGRLYYCTQRGGYSEAEIRIDERAQHHAMTALATIDTAIASGFLVAAPAEGACNICDYHAVCGPYEEQRILRKSKARLVQLIQLRETP